MLTAKWPSMLAGVALVATLTLGSVAPTYADSHKKKTLTGALLGAGVGALLGNSKTALVGAVLGGIVGSSIKK